MQEMTTNPCKTSMFYQQHHKYKRRARMFRKFYAHKIDEFGACTDSAVNAES